MSIDMQSTNSVLATVNTVMALGKAAVEIAKKTKDTELKEKLSELQSGIHDLRETVVSLEDENRELKRKLVQRGTITRDPRYGYWFKESEAEPLCPKCYEGDDRVVYLQPVRAGSRKCNVCNSSYYESSSDAPAFSIASPGVVRQARRYFE